MSLIYLCYAQEDEALAARVAGRLRAHGAVVTSEPGAELERPPVERMDGVAARAKAADLIAVLAGPGRESLEQARRALRAAFAYDRRLAIARLDAVVSLDALARDQTTRAGTPFFTREDAAAAKAHRVFDLRPVVDAPPSEAEAAPLIGPPGVSEEALEAFAAHALAVAATGRQERLDQGSGAPSEGGETDALGFPKSPAAMLARWRLIEPQDSLLALESFLIDYADDPHFAMRASGAIEALRRRWARRRGATAYRVAMSAMLAGGLVWTASALCADGACAAQGVASAAVEPRDAGAREAAGPREAALRRAEAARARVERELAATKRQREEARALLAAFNSDDAEAQRDAIESRVAELERENARLRDTVRIVEAERDRFKAAARDRALERDALIAQAARPASAEAAEARIIALAKIRRRADARILELQQTVGGLETALSDRDAEIRTLRQENRQENSQENSQENRQENHQENAARAEAGPRPIAPQPASSAAVAGTPQTAASIAGGPLVKVLAVVREELEIADQERRAQAGVDGSRPKGPFLSREGVRLLQRCLRSETGLPRALDGLWGRRTTAAMLALAPEQAEGVADCLRDRLRRS